MGDSITLLKIKKMHRIYRHEFTVVYSKEADWKLENIKFNSAFVYDVR